MFHLVNTAVKYHRIRWRHFYETSSNPSSQHGSLAALVEFFVRNGLDAPAIQNLLNRLSIELVFTAHPTEATRRSLIIKSRRLAELLEARDHEAEMTPHQPAVSQRDIESTLALFWRTGPVQRVRLQ